MAETKTPVYICPLGHLTPASGMNLLPGESRHRCPECSEPVVKYFISDPFSTVHDAPARAGSGAAADPPDPPEAVAAAPAPAVVPAEASPPAANGPKFASPAASPTRPYVPFAAPASTPSPRSVRPPVPGAPVVVGYTILGEMGRGAMGVVYKARHEKLKRAVALKMILIDPMPDPYYLEWFQAEAEAVARLHHPNIVQIYEVGEQDGRPFLALEFISGGTLKKRLDRKPQPLRASAHFVEILARAVNAAHLRGIVHRDLKPANVLLENSTPNDELDGLPVDQLEADQVFGTPKITDFGLCKRTDDEFDPVRQGDVVGTPLYMAPEQARGEAEEVGPAADVYALGAILYEMLTGRPPFVAGSVDEILRRISKEPAVPPRRVRRQIPRDLEAICLRCLEKDPRMRYRSAPALAEDLQRFREGMPTRARRAGPVTRAWNWSLHNRVPASLLLAVTLVLAVGQWQLRSLSNEIVAKSAQASAAQQTATIGEVYALYSEVAKQVKDAQGDASKLDLTHKYPAEHAIPIPARFTILLGEKMEALIEDNPNGRQGHMFSKLHVFSNYPFRERRGNPPKPGTFAAVALKNYEDHPEKVDAAFHRMETDADDRKILRYATPLVLKETCLVCHNNKENYEAKYRGAARTDWKVGDVRGVLVIDVPLTKEFKQTNEEILGAYLNLAALAAAALAASWLTLTLARR